MPVALPPPRLRARVGNRLRRLKRRWRRTFPRPILPWTDPVATVTRTADRVDITVESAGRLRDHLGESGSARHLAVVVTAWSAPWPGWSGRLGPVPGLRSFAVRLPKQGAGPASVEVTVAEPASLADLVAAVLAVVEPVHPLPAALRPEPADGPAATARCPGSAGDQILVDATAASPRGRSRYDHERPAGVLTLSDTAWSVEVDRTVVVAGRAGDPLDARQAAVLTQLGVVTHDPGLTDAAAASVIAQLAMTGLILSAGQGTGGRVTGAPAHEYLDHALRAVVAAPLPGPEADPIEWELRSIAQRRAALRGHATGIAGPGVQLPAVSALLVTRRPERVAGALAMLAAQTYPELEIVLGLHGMDQPYDAIAAAPVPVKVLELPAELSFGAALAAATRSACGSLVTKVDDDDRYGPEHVWDLVLARHYSGAVVAGKAAEFVHLSPYEATIRRRMGSELFSDVVAGGAFLIARGDLEEVGGWRPLPRAVDRALLDRVLRAGGLVYRTHGFGFVYSRHASGHTWDPGLPYFLRNPLRHWPGWPPYGEFA